MELNLNYVEQFGQEWQNLQENLLTNLSLQCNGERLSSYEEILPKIFHSTDFEQDDKCNKDKELCEKNLTECVTLLSNRPNLVRKSEIKLICTLAKFTCLDESCFINLNGNNVLDNLVYLSRSYIKTTITQDVEIKKLFLEMLHSFLEHQSGTQEIFLKKYWKIVYDDCIEVNEKSLEILEYTFLSRLLSKGFNLNKEFCEEIINTLVSPLFRTYQSDGFSQPSPLDRTFEKSMICLIEILENLLVEYNANVLNCFLNSKVDLASDNVSKCTYEDSLCIILHRISMLLSIFKMCDVFDGIKSISEDPLIVSGIFRIINNEIERSKGHLIFKITLHALRYLKLTRDKIPRCLSKGKTLDLENELICFHVLPIALLVSKYDIKTFMRMVDTDIVRQTYISKFMHNTSINSLQIGVKVRQLIPSLPIQMIIDTVKDIIEYKDIYSKVNLGLVFETFIYSLQDVTDFMKHASEDLDMSIKVALEEYTLEVVIAIRIFIQSFNLGWSDSVKILELTNIINCGCPSHKWPTQISIHAFKLLQEVISRRLSPSMSLLIDSADDLKGFGLLLYQKCFTSEWEVRNAVLELVHTIAVSANRSFSSFKEVLLEADLPNLISTMALNDEFPTVRAAALKCLRDMIVWEDINSLLPRDVFINKILDLLSNADEHSSVKLEIIKILATAYLHNTSLDNSVLMKVFKQLEIVMLNCNDNKVQLEVLYFFMAVMKKHLVHQGWVDKKFPSVTFSKRIICMTNAEVRKRIYKALNDLSSLGFLNVLVKIFSLQNLSQDAVDFGNKMVVRINQLFQLHDVTPESMSMSNHEFPNFSNSFYQLSPESPNTDSIIQEMCDDTVMKLLPDDMNFIQDEDLYSLIDNRSYFKSCLPPHNVDVTPADFVQLIDQKVAFLKTINGNIETYFTAYEIQSDILYDVTDD
ncbi:hypothetical protein ABEB36_013808 [Hypothenemus hampei]|uniref:Uncharacterized protein n=1 Tax=Hypothenemus hampei TaxID=57062 RepID=A0ABD1E690_HYPHA